MEIEFGKVYILDDLELQLKRKNEDVYTFNIINKPPIYGVQGLMYRTCIIKNRINEIKIK